MQVNWKNVDYAKIYGWFLTIYCTYKIYLKQKNKWKKTLNLLEKIISYDNMIELRGIKDILVYQVKSYTTKWTII